MSGTEDKLWINPNLDDDDLPARSGPSPHDQERPLVTFFLAASLLLLLLLPKVLVPLSLLPLLLLLPPPRSVHDKAVRKGFAVHIPTYLLYLLLASSYSRLSPVTATAPVPNLTPHNPALSQSPPQTNALLLHDRQTATRICEPLFIPRKRS
jgi:hypothetical protein